MKYISTLAFTQNPEYYFDPLIKSNLGIEFSSGGIKHSIENYKYLSEFPGKKLIHNYFPGYKSDPFVLNISSLNDEVLNKSISHCKRNIQKTAKHSTENFFAVHAGFMLEVNVSDLGKKFSNISIINKNRYRQRFIETLKELLEYANELGVNLYVENNVLIKENYYLEIPFFFVESQNILEIFHELRHFNNLGLLLDTGHLKVSCETLDLNIENELEKISPLIKAIHHSDNDGKRDSNSPLTENYWFLPYKSLYSNLPQVLEVKSLTLDTIFKQIQFI